MSDNISLNFATRPKQVAPPAVVEAPRLRETVRVSPTQEARSSYLLRTPDKWDWQDLQSYVASQIIAIHGPFPRDDRKEAGIFKGFVSRHGALAGPIAKFAFEQADGYWMNAPIQVTRFTKGSDPYFAERIITRLQG
jgi:hypothetical protein